MGVEMQVASAFIGLMAAQKQKQTYEMQAQAYEEQAKNTEITTAQQVVERNRQLAIQLASLSTSMASQGVGIGTSGSVLALKENEQKLASADISSIKLMGMGKTRQLSLSASSARVGGQGVVLGSLAKTAMTGYEIQRGVSESKGTA